MLEDVRIAGDEFEIRRLPSNRPGVACSACFHQQVSLTQVVAYPVDSARQ
jgi:hypothetical protein